MKKSFSRFAAILAIPAIALLPAFSYAARTHIAPPDMVAFNKICPAPKLCETVQNEMDLCQAEGKKCSNFINDYRKLLPEYDCQRPFDSTPTVKYIVPAMWLCSSEQSENFLSFLSKLKSGPAKSLFKSPEVRNALDGELLELYDDLYNESYKAK